mgnify:CR=1 FL=1
MPQAESAAFTRTPRTFYWMVVPAAVIFFGLHTVPVLSGMFFSFTNYAGYGEWSFIGLSNYINLFRDERILNAYGFTFLFAPYYHPAMKAIGPVRAAMGVSATNGRRPVRAS